MNQAMGRFTCSLESSSVPRRVRAARCELYVAFFGALALLIPDRATAQSRVGTRWTEFNATVSQWHLGHQTSESRLLWTWTLSMGATRWKGSRGVGGRLLVTTGDRSNQGLDNAPLIMGLAMDWTVRSEATRRRGPLPILDAALGGGVLAFFNLGGLLAPQIQPGGSAPTLPTPSFRQGAVPFLSLGAGLTLPTPVSLAVRAEGKLDMPLRAGDMPGGGGWSYYRVGVGLALQR